MQFESLVIQNFLAISSARLDFSPGVHLIQGRNLDVSASESNGAGKSSILDALTWGLFGSLDRTGAKVSDVVNRVVGKDCLVEVTWSHAGRRYGVRRTRDHKGLPPITLTVDGVEQVHHVQDATQAAVLAALPIDRRLYDYGVMVGQAFPNRFLDLPEADKRALLARIVDLTVYDTATERAKEQVQRVQQAVASAEGGLSVLEAQVAAKQADVDAAVAAETALDPSLGATYEQNALKAAQTLAEWTAYCAQQEALARQAGEAVKALRAQVDAAQVALSTVSGKREACTGELRAAERRLQAYRSLGEACSVCEQAISAEHKAGQVNRLQAEVDVLKQTEQDWGRQVAAAQAGYQEVRGQMAAQTEAWERAQAEQGKAQRTRTEWVAYEGQQRALWAQWAARGQEVQGRVQAAREGLAELQDRIWKQGVALIEVQTEARHWTYWRDMLPGVKAAALDSVLGHLNERIADHLDTLSAGTLGCQVYQKAHGQGSRIQVDLRTPAGSYGLSSGGEKRRVDLALYLAIADLVALSSGVEVNLLVCDEVTDGLSMEGVRHFLQALRSLGEDRCILVVSHNPAVQHSGEFDSVVEVVKERGLATVVGGGHGV